MRTCGRTYVHDTVSAFKERSYAGKSVTARPRTRTADIALPRAGHVLGLVKMVELDRRAPCARCVPQPHAHPSWTSALLADELDACGFQTGANIPQKVIVWSSLVSLKIADGGYSHLACLGKPVL